MSEWCQNKECCYKKNQNQIRGVKGNKHYQSNKAHSYYYNMFCCQGCFHAWFKANKNTCMNAIGIIGKQTVGVENAWEISAEYNYQTTNGNSHDYFLTNKLIGVRQPITRQQAQTPEQIRNDHGWCRKLNSEAMPLAIELGLAS